MTVWVDILYPEFKIKRETPQDSIMSSLVQQLYNWVKIQIPQRGEISFRLLSFYQIRQQMNAWPAQREKGQNVGIFFPHFQYNIFHALIPVYFVYTLMNHFLIGCGSCQAFDVRKWAGVSCMCTNLRQRWRWIGRLTAAQKHHSIPGGKNPTHHRFNLCTASVVVAVYFPEFVH